MSMAPTELSLEHDRELGARIEERWNEIFARGEVAYDPADARVFRFRQFLYHYIPGRSSRPGANVALSPLGLKRPHTPGPFDDIPALEAREVLHPRRESRDYFLIANKFPVKRLHLLLVRDPREDAATLPQRLFGPAEIEDALRLARGLGPEYRSFFNSNSGADGSSSGSTVNHWHFQILPHGGGAFEQLFLEHRGPAPLGPEAGRLPAWEIPHVLHHGTDLPALATAIWPAVERVTELGCAYNLEIAVGGPDGHTAVALFARAPLPPTTIPGFGEFSNRYGGWELSGDVVIYDEDVFDWICEHPEEADALAWRRLRDGTRDLF